MDVDFIDSLGPEFNEIKELVKRVVSIESKVLALHRVLTGPIQKTYPDDAKIWGDLVVCIETFDGGLSRNSSPEALQAWRDIYNALLSKFPLFYGYWSRWATFEFNISGPEAAEYVRQLPPHVHVSLADEHRCMREVSPQLVTLLTYATHTASSEWRPVMMSTLSESK